MEIFFCKFFFLNRAFCLERVYDVIFFGLIYMLMIAYGSLVVFFFQFAFVMLMFSLDVF